MGKSGKTKMPSWFDTSLRLTPVAELIATTVAPLMMAWLVSTTVPRMLPMACADNRPAVPSNRAGQQYRAQSVRHTVLSLSSQLDCAEEKGDMIPSRGFLLFPGFAQRWRSG